MKTKYHDKTVHLAHSIVDAAKRNSFNELKGLLLEASKLQNVIALPIPNNRGSKSHTPGHKNRDYQAWRMRIKNACKDIGGIKKLKIDFVTPSQFSEVNQAISQEVNQNRKAGKKTYKRTQNFRKSGRHITSKQEHTRSAECDVYDRSWTLRAWEERYKTFQSMRQKNQLDEKTWQSFLTNYRWVKSHPQDVYDFLSKREIRKNDGYLKHYEEKYKKALKSRAQNQLAQVDFFEIEADYECALICAKKSARAIGDDREFIHIEPDRHVITLSFH